MFDHNETDLLKILIVQQRETNALLADEKRLLQFVAAETLASKQLLQQIVDNTTPSHQFTLKGTQLHG